MKHEFSTHGKKTIKHICKEQKKGEKSGKNIGKQPWTEKNLNKIFELNTSACISIHKYFDIA